VWISNLSVIIVQNSKKTVLICVKVGFITDFKLAQMRSMIDCIGEYT